MKKSLLFLLMAMTIVSCKNKTSDKSQASEVKDQAVAEPITTKGKYSVKSGIVEYKIEMMGMNGTQTLYFDNYGNTEANLTVLDVMGTKSETVTITKDGTVYNFVPQIKTGSKTTVMSGANVNFENLTDKVIKEWNLKKEGKENILGKECDKFSMDNQAMSMKGYYWVWKGVALKVDATISTVKMLMDASIFQENVNIPAEKFDIPADIVFN
jgi:hypothetical protein